MCASNQAAADLLADQALPGLLRGRTLVQLTTGTPADGRRNAAWAQPPRSAMTRRAATVRPW